MRKAIVRFFRGVWEGHLRMLEIKSSIYAGIELSRM